MPYITKKTPTPRSTDTTLGKVMGYLAELLEYLKWENMALSVDTLFPDVWPLDLVQNLLINVCRGLYDRIYQGAYNRGADKGNEINNQIVGWLDALRSQAFSEIDKAKAYIQTNLINPIKSNIDTYITPKIKEAMSHISTIETNINTAFKNINTMTSKITGFDSQLKSFARDIESQRNKLNEIVEVANNTVAQLRDLENVVNNIDNRLRAVEGKPPTTPLSLESLLKG